MHVWYIVFQVLKVILKKKQQQQQDTATSSLIPCCFTSAFTSADIIFCNYLEPHSTFSEK